MSLPSDRGVLVSEVQSGSSADAAGLKAGDIVIDFGGTPVASIDALHRELKGDRIGQPIPLRILRQGAPRRVVVVRRASWRSLVRVSVDSLRAYDLPAEAGSREQMLHS